MCYSRFVVNQATNRQIRFTSTGEEIQFRTSGSVRFSRTFTSVIRLAIVAALLGWTGPALKVYFETGKITGALQLLERFHLSDRWMFAAIVTGCVLLTWWILGSIYELLKTHLERDQFLLRSDGLFVKRTKIIPQEFHFKSYDPLEVRLRPQDGALEAKNNKGSYVLTDGGTAEDREWLMDLLRKRYRFPQIQTGTSTIENVATYKVERRPDHSLFITSSALSRIGCAAMAAVACVALIVLAVWLFKKGSGSGFIPLLFFVAFAAAGLASLNRRSVEASRGHLLVKWSSPVGTLLRRFISLEKMFHHPVGEGQYERDDGILTIKTIKQPKREPTFKIVICSKPFRKVRNQSKSKSCRNVQEEADAEKDELDEGFDDEIAISDPLIEEEIVLKFTGSTSRSAAEYTLNLLSETTGFPTEQY